MAGEQATFPKVKDRHVTEMGNLEVRIDHDRDGVIIDFGRNVSGMKINPDSAIAFAKNIEQHAIAAKIGI